MKLLKNKAAWKRWMKSHDMQDYPEPQAYPCFGYAIVESFGYETEQPVYLYRGDIHNMIHQLDRASEEK